mmetsp:Transcript_24762/g.51864  ORF Transcript_24762/g.51864 Transcript_24762/m.51864 type:complete len:201 (-) Transcript_24762:1244-1846(-)
MNQICSSIQRSRRNNGRSNALSPRFVAISSQNGNDGSFIKFIANIRSSECRSRITQGCRIVGRAGHTHIQRTIFHECKSTFSCVNLMRRHSEIEEHSIGSIWEFHYIFTVIDAIFSVVLSLSSISKKEVPRHRMPNFCQNREQISEIRLDWNKHWFPLFPLTHYLFIPYGIVKDIITRPQIFHQSFGCRGQCFGIDIATN